MKAIKTNHTDQCLHMLNLMQIKVEDYTFNGSLDLRNMGPEVRLLVNDKLLVPTGIRAHCPNGLLLMIQEKTSIINTKILVRNTPAQNEEGSELYVCLLNLGNDEVLIPAGAKLPAQLLALSIYNDSINMNYQEYLNTVNPKTQG